MNLTSTFRLLALAALVTAPVLAQQTTRRVIVVPANAAPGLTGFRVTGWATTAANANNKTANFNSFEVLISNKLNNRTRS